MKLRTAAFVLAISASACTAASDKPRGTAQHAQASSAAPQVRAATAKAPDSIRSSFQDCVDKAGGATWPTQDCIADEYDYQDARLNRVFHRLMQTLPGNEAAELRTKQRAWIVERDATCPWDVDTEGQGQRLEANYCAMERTAGRAAELEQLLETKQPAR